MEDNPQHTPPNVEAPLAPTPALSTRETAPENALLPLDAEDRTQPESADVRAQGLAESPGHLSAPISSVEPGAETLNDKQVGTASLFASDAELSESENALEAEAIHNDSPATSALTRSDLELEHVPGYFSVKEAARIMGVSERSVYGYIESGKLPGKRIGNVIVVISDYVRSYERKAPGRTRIKTPLWHTPPEQNVQLLTTITARLRPGQSELLKSRLYEIRVAKKHRLLGTSARYIVRNEHDPNEVEILLLWRSAAMPPTDIREAALGAFYADLADIIDWNTLARKEGRVIMHA